MTDDFELSDFDKMQVDVGHAINANNGRCAIIEDVLCRTMSFCSQARALLLRANDVLREARAEIESLQQEKQDLLSKNEMIRAVMEAMWCALNRERGSLIDKRIAGTITPDEDARLNRMQKIADSYLDLVAPRPDPEDLIKEIQERRERELPQ